MRRRNGDRLVTDGPFAETKEQLWGYYDVEAPDLDVMLDVCDGLWEVEHGSVEIRPMFPEPRRLRAHGPDHGVAGPSRATSSWSPRAERARVLASVARDVRDLELAEDAVQEALLAAVKTWPRDGVPTSPRRLADHRGARGRRCGCWRRARR